MLLLLASPAPFQSKDSDKSCTTDPAPCFPSDCCTSYCYGPKNVAASPPVGPKTCGGDFVVEVSGFYWSTNEEGLDYAIRNDVAVPQVNPTEGDIQQLNNLIDAKYETFPTHWDFGWKVGIGYVTPCDGWDFKLGWTHYSNYTPAHLEVEARDNQTAVLLWSAFNPAQGPVEYATKIDGEWKVTLDMVDLELGRAFWNSKRLSLRPSAGLRFASIGQDLTLEQRGGSFAQDAFNNKVKIDNDYKGAGIRMGLDSLWHLGCGFGIYGKGCGSILYGRFELDHDEENRLASSPYSKQKVLETEARYHASRGILDLALGVQWAAHFCECKYGIAASLGWEHHLFFHQNQMWRVNRTGDENTYQQRQGSLATQGWTLRFKFEF